jgi:hypothetical protein
MSDNSLGWFTSGANIVSQGMEHRLRSQQQRSLDADRRVRERLLAQQIEQTDLENQKIRAGIAEKAVQDAQWLDVNTTIRKQQHIAEAARDAGFEGPLPDPLVSLDEAAMQLAGSNLHARNHLIARKTVEDFQYDRARRQREEAAINFTPTGMVEPTTGARVVQEAPGKWQAFAPERTDTEKPLSTVGRLISDRNAAFAAGDKTAVSQYDAAIQKAVTPTGMTIKTNPDGTVEVTQGAVSTKTPVGVSTKVLERLGQTEKAINEMNDLALTLRPEDVGAKGVVGEQLLDRVLPQFGIASSDVKRMDNRAKLKTLSEGMLRQVSADSRFSNADRADIKAILPSSGAIESYEHTQQTIKTLRKIFSKRALIDAKEGSLPAPPWALRNLDALALAESFRAGLISKDEALRAFNANHQ